MFILVKLMRSSLLSKLELDLPMLPIPYIPPIMFLPTSAPELDSRILLLRIPPCPLPELPGTF